MKLQICVKGISNREKRVQRMTWDYPDGTYTMEAFLRATVSETLKRNDAAVVRSVLTAAEMADAAEEGKIGFGIQYNEKKPDPAQAQTTALQAFADGLTAVFVDGTQYEALTDVLPLREGSEIVFIRLAFLSGRLW